MAVWEEGDREMIRHRHPERAWVLAVLVHLGLLAVCVSAVMTLQPPTWPGRKWLGVGVLALVLISYALVTRGRSAFTAHGKLLTALAAGIVLSLAYEPQLSTWGRLGEVMPSWLADTAPGLGMVGALWAGFWGLVYLGLVHRDHRHGVVFGWPVALSAVLVAGLGLVTFIGLGAVYEIEPYYLSLLLGNVVQYGLLLSVVIGLSGRIGIGSGMQLYLALTLLLAIARNLSGGGGV